jgi:Mg2+ and Co2+ transporter CorA
MVSVSNNRPSNDVTPRAETAETRKASAMAKEMHHVITEAKSAKSAFDDRMNDLRSQIADESNPQRKLELQQEMTHLQQLLKTMENQIASSQFDPVEAIQNFRSELIASYDRIAPAGGLDTGATSGAGDNPDVGAPASSGKTSSQGADDVHHFIGKTPDELVNLMDKDPQAFYGELRNLSPNDRSMVMQQVQLHLQQMNQLFSMMSQMSQSLHDTTKAVISNLRV